MSEHYRALTRKYRPLTFDDIVSQDHVSDTLKNAIRQNRLSHAYMFCGPRGVGKTTMARVLARTINNIDNEVDGESLNQTLNVVEIDAASNNKVEDVHHLRESVRIPPQNGRYKVFIIDEVHMLSKSAFNALLKTLEEPPDHVIFIFATTEPHKVLPTILSRVQRFDFKRIKVEEMVERLRGIARDEQINIDDESLHVIAKKADGALRDALGLMDQAIAFCGSDIRYEELLRALNVVSTERMFEVMEAVRTHNAETGLNLVNDLLQEGYDIQEYLIGLTEHLRNLYVAKSSRNMHLVEASPDMKKRYAASSEHFSQDDLMRMLHLVSEAQFKIREAQQPRIQFEITLLKLIHMQRSETLQQLITGLEHLKKNFSNGQIDGKAASGTRETADAASERSDITSASAPEATGQPSDASEADEHDEAYDTDAEPEPVMHRTPGPESENPPAPSPEENEPASKSTPVPEPEGPRNFLGQPSLNKYKQKSLNNSNSGNTAVSTAPAPPHPGATVEDRPPNELKLHELKETWPRYVEELKKHVPQMLYFQMQRIEPIALKHGEVLLRCGDPFALKMVEENETELRKILKRVTGATLRLTCKIEQSAEQKRESMSPYERFKKLQEKDPTIRTIVELFGAELEY